MSAAPQIVDSWHPADWREYPAAQQPDYREADALAAVERALARADPVVSTADCVRLRTLAARVADGNSFILQGGDCAESLGQSTAATVSALAGLFDRLTAALPGETVRIGRIAGQFAKPRSTDWEARGVVRLPAYRGDGINGAAFNEHARRADPERMLAVHAQAVETEALLRTIAPPIFASHEALLLPYEQALARRDDHGRWCRPRVTCCG